MITHLEPDILKCKVGLKKHHYKDSGGDGIPCKLFQILKNDAVKVLHSICQQVWKAQQWPLDGKRAVFIPMPKERMTKNVQTTVQLHSFHMQARLCSKYFKLSFRGM